MTTAPVAFTVDDVRGIYAKAIERGAKSIREPWEETDADGTVLFATIATVRLTRESAGVVGWGWKGGRGGGGV